MVTVFLAILVLAVPHGITLENFFIGVLAPLSPAILLGYRQFTEQTETAGRLDALREHSERLWTDALTGHPPVLVTSRSRILQDEIFDSRKKSPLVFDFVFSLMRDSNERLMNHGADHFIAEAKERL